MSIFIRMAILTQIKKETVFQVRGHFSHCTFCRKLRLSYEISYLVTTEIILLLCLIERLMLCWIVAVGTKSLV